MRVFTPYSERLLRFAWLLLLVLTISLYLLRQIGDGPFGKDFTIFLTGAHLLLVGRHPTFDSLAAPTAVRIRGRGHHLSRRRAAVQLPTYVAALIVPVALFPANVAFYSGWPCSGSCLSE